jgi:hypothetical protein
MPKFTDSQWWKWLSAILPLNWRSFAIWASVAITTIAINRCAPPEDGPLPLPEPPTPYWPLDVEEGWVPPSPEDTAEVMRMDRAYHWKATPAGVSQTVLDGDAYLWKFSEKVRGRAIPARNQGQVGSCTAFGGGTAAEYALDAQIALGKSRQKPVDIAHEHLYAALRVDVNGGRVPFNGDGGTGAWVSKAMLREGLLARDKYDGHDLTNYSEQRCRAWGNSGVPAALKPLAKQNLVGSVALVTSATDAKKALQQAYPIFVCSMVGFNNTRNSDGFLRPTGQWAHCMAFVGYRKDKDAFFCMNSWGSTWANGPLGAGNPPDGGFWVDSATVGRMLREGDSYAVSSVGGFPANKIRPEDWIVVRDPVRPAFAAIIGGFNR